MTEILEKSGIFMKGKSGNPVNSSNNNHLKSAVMNDSPRSVILYVYNISQFVCFFSRF